MSPKNLFAALLASAFAAALTGSAGAGGNSSHGGCGCSSNCCGGTTVNKPVSVYKPTTINNNVNVYKPVTVNKNISIFKPTTITNNVSIYKPVTVNKSITIVKNVDASKYININKTIIINKGGGAEASAYAAAFATAMAQASASAGVTSNLVIYSGYNEYITVNNHIGGGEVLGVQATGQCEMQDANVVKAIHAVCVAPDGQEFPASHMTGDTWIDTSREGEILRCIPGAHLRVTVGDVLQSDQGLAGTSEGGEIIECTQDEALRHFKDGMLKCAPKVPVKDCTERTNLRLYGTGDMFFSYRSRVCVPPRTASRELDLSGLSLDGGVGSGQ